MSQPRHTSLMFAMGALAKASHPLSLAYNSQADQHVFPSHTSRFFGAHPNAVPQSIYLGLFVALSPASSMLSFSISSHDASVPLDLHSASIDCSLFNNPCDHEQMCTVLHGYRICLENMITLLIDTISKYTSCNHYKPHVLGLAVDCYAEQYAEEIKDCFSDALSKRLWLEADILPIVLHLPPLEGGGAQATGPFCYVELEMCADSLARKVIAMMNPQFPGATLQLNVVDEDNQVDVDLGRALHLVDLNAYKQLHCSLPTLGTLPPNAHVDVFSWQQCMRLVDETKAANKHIAFFSSTPQGGGVALMRHALIRLARLCGVNMTWHVARPHPHVFDITKRKFHNVLQGVSSAALTPNDQQLWEQWVHMNARRFWLKPGGVVASAALIVIDDPQLCAIIPMIKQAFPHKRIVFRLHIQLDTPVIEGEDAPSTTVWNYLYSNFIQHADTFIMHPIPCSIPHNVPHDRIAYFPACTDPFDGLNKLLPPTQLHYWKNVFRRLCIDQGARGRFDVDRRYIVQIARFDPSKGIPDVIEAYYRFCTLLDTNDNHPQLVLCGHGSIDDPDGQVVFEATLDLLNEERYAPIASDVCIARIPACDQILNAIISDAWVALQLSYREGFEVKVTEALMKGVPVLAYNAGGIPSQIHHGQTGYVEAIGDVDAVVSRLMRLYTDPQLYDSMSRAAKDATSLPTFYTMQNLCRWLSL